MKYFNDPAVIELAMMLGIPLPAVPKAKRPVSIRTMKNRTRQNGQVYSVDLVTGTRSLVR